MLREFGERGDPLEWPPPGREKEVLSVQAPPGAHMHFGNNCGICQGNTTVVFKEGLPGNILVLFPAASSFGQKVLYSSPAGGAGMCRCVFLWEERDPRS